MVWDHTSQIRKIMNNYKDLRSWAEGKYSEPHGKNPPTNLNTLLREAAPETFYACFSIKKQIYVNTIKVKFLFYRKSLIIIEKELEN